MTTRRAAGAARVGGTGKKAATRKAASELETRQRLIDAGAQLFAEHGFERVTVRQICRAAGANVAAVNYHFGDKLGLYIAVIRSAIATIRELRDRITAASAGHPAEDRLRAYIHAYIERVFTSDRRAWIQRLMARETAEPTPALGIIVDEALRPQFEYLGAIVRELLGCPPDDPRVMRTTLSIQAQCVIYLPTPVSMRFSAHRAGAAPVDAIAGHIAEFSLAGIRALKRVPARSR